MRRGLAIAFAAALAACGHDKPPEAPKPDPRVGELEKELTDTKEQLRKERDAAEALKKDDVALKAKADEAKALQDKLAEAVGKAGEVTTADGAVKLELVDQILFPVGEADLSESGREVLSKVGAALKDVDKQIWVQGHTDDQPIYVKKAAKPEPAKPVVAKKGAKPNPKDAAKTKPDEKKKDDAVLAFITNWELSAARALTVVHYLQDDAKIEPAKLAAVAFGQYRPVSRSKAKNRRIEIVLYPRVAVVPK